MEAVVTPIRPRWVYWPDDPGEMGPLLPDGDNGRWLILMGRSCATTPEMINAYIQTLAEVKGSEEAAKNKIHERYFGFGREVDEETSNFRLGMGGAGKDVPVIVMTPVILLNGLRHKFFQLDEIKVLVFSEYHHASGKHPYSCTMKESYHKQLIPITLIFLRYLE